MLATFCIAPTNREAGRPVDGAAGFVMLKTTSRPRAPNAASQPRYARSTPSRENTPDPSEGRTAAPARKLGRPGSVWQINSGDPCRATALTAYSASSPTNADDRPQPTGRAAFVGNPSGFRRRFSNDWLRPSPAAAPFSNPGCRTIGASESLGQPRPALANLPPSGPHHPGTGAKRQKEPRSSITLSLFAKNEVHRQCEYRDHPPDRGLPPPA